MNKNLPKVTWQYHIYFGKGFVFWSLINKNVLELFLLKMCKEKALKRSTNLLGRNHPILCFWLIRRLAHANTYYFLINGNCPESYVFLDIWTVTSSTYGSVHLEFFRTVTSVNHTLKKQPNSLCRHELSILISCFFPN